jgi:Domain of unknown function (DUF1735).
MKAINKFIYFLIVINSFWLSGCLKDSDFDKGLIQSVHSSGTQKVVEIKLSATSSSNFLQLNFLAVNADTSFDLVPIVLASSEPAPEDIKVTVVVDNSIVTAYNNANGTSYTIPSASNFTIVNPGGVVTIPKGSNVGYLKLKLNPYNFLGDIFGFGFKITAVSNPGYTISGNTGSGIFVLGIKNKYEANYHATGVFHHPVNGDRPINRDKFLSTVDSQSNITELGDLGAAGYEMILTVNADNTVTITPAGVTPNIDQHWGPNTYDPATQTYHLNYSYNVAAPRIVQEDLVRK